MVRLPAFRLSLNTWPTNNVSASNSRSIINAPIIIAGSCSQLLRSRFFAAPTGPFCDTAAVRTDESASKNQTLIPLTLKMGQRIAEGLWIKRLMRGAGDIAIKLSETGGKGFTIMAADFGDLLQHGLLFNQRRRHDLRDRFRRGRRGDSTQLVDQFFTRGVVIQHIRQCAIGRFFCSISGSGAGSVVESVVVVVVTPGMDTAWAGAPSRQKRMNRIHRMTPPVRKQSKR